MAIKLPEMLPNPGLRKYAVVPTSELYSMDYSILEDDSIETTRISVDTMSAIIEYREEIENGYTETEILAFISDNYWDWNEDTTIIEIPL